MCTVKLPYLYLDMLLLYYVILCIYNIIDIILFIKLCYSHNINYMTYVTLFIILHHYLHTVLRYFLCMLCIIHKIIILLKLLCRIHNILIYIISCILYAYTYVCVY